jgi:hypothetical protein
MNSALGNRAKCFTMRGGVDYVRYTLDHCLQKQKDFWRPRGKDEARTPVGRPLSKSTTDVLKFYEEQPSLRPNQIATKLKLNPATVRKILSRYRGRATAVNVGAPAERSNPQAWPDSERRPLSRGRILDCINKHPGWITLRTLLIESRLHEDILRTELQSLRRLGKVDEDGRERYRVHRRRKYRRLKPCHLKPFPKCRDIGRERKYLTCSGLRERGWPIEMIRARMHELGKDYIERDVLNPWTLRMVRTRLYRISRIKLQEVLPGFELERASILRQPAITHNEPQNPKTGTSSWRT